MPRGRKPSIKENLSPADNLKNTESKVSMVLGALIVLVIGILVFNYFNKNKADLGPAQQTEITESDITPENLPGKYTIKDGDTLFLIAEKYYSDGEKFSEIAKANNLTDANAIEVGQIINIPKLSEEMAQASSLPEASVNPTPTSEPVLGTGGGDTTVWGPKINSDTYTVTEGDWLSTISARAYGDVFSYQKIAAANNITDPNLIYPGQVLKLPR